MDYYLHHVSPQLSRTPLLYFIHFFLVKLKYNRGLQLPSLLNIWLESLQSCDVDLKEYGQTEFDMFQQGLVDWDFTQLGTWRITRFKYGSSPNDWCIELEQLSDSSTESPGDMPGGWIKNDQSWGEADVVDEDDQSEGEADVVDEDDQSEGEADVMDVEGDLWLQQGQSVRAQ